MLLKWIRGAVIAVTVFGISGVAQACDVAPPESECDGPVLVQKEQASVTHARARTGRGRSGTWQGSKRAVVPIGSCVDATVRGTAYEDLNENGKRDAGEPTMAGAWWKVSDGGSWFVCGYTGADSTYGVPVTEQGMTFFVYAIAPKGWRTTTPMVKTKTVSTANGYAYLYNDLGFVRDASATAIAACDQYSPKVVTPPSILMTANSTGTFKTLVAAAIAAGLANTLNMDGAMTVFAPNDAAFAKLPAGTVEALLKDPTKLAGILKYHILADKVPASQVVKAVELTTLQGGRLKVSLAGGGVMINNAKVLATDIMASNGIVHVIDTVLLP